MRDRLVLADRPAEDHALTRVVRRFAQRHAANAHRLGGDENALRIHAVQNGAEALPFRTDTIRGRHRHAVEEHLVGS